MVILVISVVEVRDHKECAFLKKNNLVSFDSWTEPIQAKFELVDVGQKNADNVWPGLVEGLIPDWSSETLYLVLKIIRGSFCNAGHLLHEHLVAHILSNQVHLVD